MSDTWPTIEKIKSLAGRQAQLLISAGTGELSFKTPGAEENYKNIDLALTAALRDVRIANPFPWRSISDWYGYYSKANLPTYQSRRDHISELANALLERLDSHEGFGSIYHPRSIGKNQIWGEIDSRIDNLIDEMSWARDKDTWQDVGRRSREILIDLGKILANPSLVPPGAEPPKAGDAKQWFDLFISSFAPGSKNDELRELMKATWSLAQKVTHGDITGAHAFAAAQATILIVRTAQNFLNERVPSA